MRHTASIITIGDELLTGHTIDTNSSWIAIELGKLGIPVTRRIAVPDEKSAIWNTLETELAANSLVILTGGLGPTADDITKPLLLEFFGGKMRTDEAVLAHVTDLFTRRNRPMLERNLLQAQVPDSCKVLFNKMGTAPGMWFEKAGKVVISLPGVPFEMASIMAHEALPLIAPLFGGQNLMHKFVITAGEGESFIAERILDLEEALPPHIKLAYLPGAGMVKLRLTGAGADTDKLEKEISARQHQIADRLSNITIALEDRPHEALLLDWFTTNGKTLALAESCTGGYIGHLLTQEPGSSAYFKGGVVSYSNEVKESMLGVSADALEHNGAINEATAVAMAEGVLKLLDADVALAVTGLLGPPSPDDTEKTGTVWIAITGIHGTKAKKFLFHYDRHRNKDMAVSMALQMIYKYVCNGTYPWQAS